MQKRIEIFAAILLLALFGIWFVLLVANPHGIQRHVFFSGADDLFGDFLNLLRYISDRDPYFNTINGLGEKAYLPIVYLLLYPFSQMDIFGTMSLVEAQASHLALVSVMLWTIGSSLLLFVGLQKLANRYTCSKLLLAPLFCSSVFLFAVERGNTIIISSACICFFLMYHDSEDKNKRYFACACLALAGGLKVYPVVFGLLLLRRKDYKSIVLAAVFSLIIVALPFLFFKHGFGNIPQLLKNLKINAVSYNVCASYPRFGLPSMTCFVMRFFHYYDYTVIFWAKLIAYALAAASCVLSLVVKDKFLAVSLVALMLVNFPENSALYTGLYLLPVVLYFMSTLTHRSLVANLVIGISFVVMLMPLQIPFLGHSLNQYIAQISIFCLWIAILFLSVSAYFVRNSANANR